LRHEVTGHVEVDAPPREPGRVLDRNRGDAPYDTGRLRLPEDRGREELPQCLEPVERARRAVGSNRDVRRAGVEPIAFVAAPGAARWRGWSPKRGRWPARPGSARCYSGSSRTQMFR